MSKIAKTMKEAVRLSARPNDTFPELARCLADLYVQDPSFLPKFVTKSGMGKRKAYYLIELGQRLKGIGVSDARLRRVGWTKMQVCAGHLTRANVRDMLKQAEDTSAEGLKVIVRGECPRGKIHRVLLNFNSAEFRELKVAILANGGRPSSRGMAAKEAAIINIVRKAASAEPT